MEIKKLASVSCWGVSNSKIQYKEGGKEMRKSAYIVIVAVVALVAFVSGNAQAQSAKFAANWSNDVVSVKAGIAYNPSDPTNTTPICTDQDGVPIEPDEDNICYNTEALLAKIGVAQQKDLLIGVSAQIGLVTLTQAKKVTDTTTLGEALAEAKVGVTVELRDPETGEVFQTAAPGPVIFAARLQEIKVGCADGDEVMVSLLLKTTAAHHFNFLGIDLDQGVYDVEAVFDLNAFASVVGVDSLAEAEVILGPRMLTLQEVRAVKDSLDPLPIPVP